MSSPLRKGFEMDVLTIVLPALLAFILGLIAAAYGARHGKALDARKQLLEEMREWIDKIQDFVHMIYQNVQGTSMLAWSNEDRGNLTRYRIVSSARWLGTSKAFGSQELYDATQEFSKAVFQFEQMYFTVMVGLSDTDPTFQQKMEGFKSLNDQFTNQAEYLHAVITKETLKVPFLAFKI